MGTRQDTTIKKRAMIEALKKSLGIVTIAAKQVGIDRDTHYRWYKTDTVYMAAVDDVQDIALDFAESQLHAQIKDKDTTATIFYLKTKGKGRGYIERKEYTGQDGAPLVPKQQTTKIDASQLSDDVLEAIMNARKKDE